jgi:hypothetical protein
LNVSDIFSGKGDLVGCDISLNLMHSGQMNTGGGQGGQDTILKSSSDVKVSFFFQNIQPLNIKQE